MINRLILLCYIYCSSFVSGKPVTKVTNEIVQSANALMSLLNKEQIEAVAFDFDDDVQRKRWSNLPTSMVPRKGLRMGDLDPKQREAVMDILRSTLSPRGFQQVLDNMYSEKLLRIRSGASNRHYSEDEYYFSILGKPSTTEPWMWQYGGHHLALNATIVKGQATLSPSFTGGNPVDFERDGKKVRQLSGDEDLSHELVRSFNEEQLKKALITGQKGKVIFGPKAKDITPRKEGIQAKNLDQKQQVLLLRLIKERVGILSEAYSDATMQKISAQLDNTYFSWFGSIEHGATSNYRIQGPSVLIEYFAQGKGHGGHMHTHAMYRDPSNDYGGWIRN